MEKLIRCLLCDNDSLIMLDTESNVMCCSECSYVFDNPRPTRPEIAEYYSRPAQYDEWLSTESDREQLWQRRLKKLRRGGAYGSLLDIGAGIGQFLAMAQPYFDDVCGTEVSTSAARIAHEKYGVEIVDNALEDIDFGDRRFDTVTLFHVLEHVHDPVAVLRKSAALLRDNGLLLIAVPNELASLRNKLRHFLHRLGFGKIKYHGLLGIPKIVLDGSIAEIHLSHFTAGVISDLVRRNGFVVVENDLDPYYVKHGFAGFFHASYYCLLRVLLKLTGKNYYDTIWLLARKQTSSATFRRR